MSESTFHRDAQILRGRLYFDDSIALLDAMVARYDKAIEELYVLGMTCPRCGQYGDGCQCRRVNDEAAGQ